VQALIQNNQVVLIS